MAGVGGGSGITSFNQRINKGGGLSSSNGRAQPSRRHTQLHRRQTDTAKSSTRLHTPGCHTPGQRPLPRRPRSALHGEVFGAQQWLCQIRTLETISGVHAYLITHSAALSLANSNLHAHPPRP